MWVAEVNGRSVGFVQDYRIARLPRVRRPGAGPGCDRRRLRDRRPAVDRARDRDPDALGVAGPDSHRRFPDAATYFAAPDHRNEASLRMLDKAGFTRGAVVRRAAGGRTVDTVVGCSLDVRRVLG